MIEKNSKLVLSGIQDTQNIIRAIDIKMQIVFGVLVIPATNAGNIVSTSKDLWHTGGPVSKILVAGFYILWFLSLYVCFKCLAGIGNPIPHVKNDLNVPGIFYLGNQFKFGFMDLFKNRTSVSQNSINEILAKLPKEQDGILSELVFEMFKITYIRDLKLARQRIVFRFSFLWATLSIIIFFVGGGSNGSHV